MASKKRFWDDKKLDTSKMDMKSINPPDTKGDYAVTRGLIKGKTEVENAQRSFVPTLLGQGMGGRVPSDPILRPDQLAGLAAWADATWTPGQAYVDGSQVGTILNRGGSAGSLAQGTGSLQPLFKLNTFGQGLHAFRFDGVDDCIRTTFTAVGTGCTFGAVFKQITIPAGNPEVMEIQAGSGRGLFCKSAGGNALTTNTGGSELVATIPTIGVIFVAIAVHESATSAISLYMNGILFTGSFATGNADALALGSNGPQNANFNNVDIGDAFCFQRALTPGEVGGLQRYFARKYSLNIA